LCFPEGPRSKTGRLDTENFQYGVGQLAVAVPSAAILCVYLRSEDHATTGFWPDRKARIYADFELIQPKSRHKGRRAARDISIQAMDSLRAMEAKYFREHPGAESVGVSATPSIPAETASPTNGAGRSLEPAG